MREYTKTDISLIIENERMDIWLPPPTPPYLRDFVKNSYTKFAWNDLENYIYRRMGVSPRVSSTWLKQTVLLYLDEIKYGELYLDQERMLFETMYRVGTTMYDLIKED